MNIPIKIGSRKSALAMAQTQQVINCVEFSTEFEIIPIISAGDKISGPLRDHGGKRLFTKDLDQALLDGTIDLAVHSMKDVETPLPEGLEIAAVPVREDPRDILIYQPGLNFEKFPLKTKIGTSSLRRSYQLNYYLKNIEIAQLRGNIQTRLQRFSNQEFAGIVLAIAGLKRMGLFNDGKIKGVNAQTQILDLTKYVPAAGQGALVVIKRSNDHRFDEALAKINHSESYIAINIERQIIEALNVSCHDPIGVYSEIIGNKIKIKVMLFDRNALTTTPPIFMETIIFLTNMQSSLNIFIESIKKACEFGKSL